jgi:protease-4
MAGMKVLEPREYDEEVIEEGSDPHDKIAVIPLAGIIAFEAEGSLGDAMVEDFKLALKQAAADPDVKAVVIETDSPGGEITASDVLNDAVRNFDADKPVIVYFNAIGASGAYYMACGADWIMCNDTTFTGSIGVIISTLNYRDLFGKIGLESVVFKSGKFKDMLNGAREMSPEEKEYVQGLVMQSYDRFLGIVAASRKLDPEKLRAGPADGRILSGTDALREKLVDQLGYIEDAYAKARELGQAPNATVVRYLRHYHFGKLLQVLGESRAAKIQLDLPGKHTALEPGRVYLLPPFFAP